MAWAVYIQVCDCVCICLCVSLWVLMEALEMVLEATVCPSQLFVPLPFSSIPPSLCLFGPSFSIPSVHTVTSVFTHQIHWSYGHFSCVCACVRVYVCVVYGLKKAALLWVKLPPHQKHPCLFVCCVKMELPGFVPKVRNLLHIAIIQITPKTMLL